MGNFARLILLICAVAPWRLGLGAITVGQFVGLDDNVSHQEFVL